MARHRPQERAFLAQDEPLAFGEGEVGRAGRIAAQPRTIGLISRETLEADHRMGDVVAAFVRHEIAQQLAAAGGNDREPGARIVLELRRA